MRIGKAVLAVTSLAVAAVAAAAWMPEKADGILPGAGREAQKLRAMVGLGAAPPASPPASGGAPAPRAQQAQRPPVSVIVAKVEQKDVPLRLDAIGTVQPAASVTLRPRVDSQIDKVFVADGASVKQGDVVVKLDSRQIEALIKQAESAIAKSRTALEQANRDFARYTELFSRQATTQLNVDNARVAVQAATAAVQVDQAALDNLKVQLTYYTVTAPISGRVGQITLKAGNIARQGETGSSFATINQLSPIYVAFSMPQRLLPDLRAAMASDTATASATPQGASKATQGKMSVIDNQIDAATGTITVRATFPNDDEFLWPGQLCNVRVVLRVDPNTIAIPREAIQSGQQGSFVYVVENGVAKVRQVVMDRIQDGEAIIKSGLAKDETIVVDGQSLLYPNARVETRGRPTAGAVPATGGAVGQNAPAGEKQPDAKKGAT